MDRLVEKYNKGLTRLRKADAYVRNNRSVNQKVEDEVIKIVSALNDIYVELQFLGYDISKLQLP